MPEIRVIRYSDIERCPKHSLLPQHYNDDGSCRCLESRPMRADELGRYVCVAHGGCRKSPFITINSDGVWVRSPDPDPLNPGSHLYSSAHRDCFDAWQASEEV